MTAPALVGLTVAGDAAAWGAAGFTVDAAGACRVGQVRMQTGVGTTGIGDWSFGAAGSTDAPVTHLNGAIVLDHVVVMTDDPERTTKSYAAQGLEPRRVRELGHGRTQTFFRAGEVIIELVGPVDGGERFFGLAFTVADLDACAVLLGDRLGPSKDAVQPGRRIATLRHEACGLTVPIAFMSPEPPRG
jgi:hypothetical protein